MKPPALNGVPLATANELQDLRGEVEELRRQVRDLLMIPKRSSLNKAIARLQAGYAALTEEEKEVFAQSEREARAFFGRGRSDG
jgi:hypothetical protein